MKWNINVFLEKKGLKNKKEAKEFLSKLDKHLKKFGFVHLKQNEKGEKYES